MAFSKQKRADTFSGIWFVSLFAFAAMYISDTSIARSFGFSALVVAIIVGMIYGNSLRHKLPVEWTPGVTFCAKNILRFAIVLYGFRITFQQVAAVGLQALAIDAIVISTTFLLGWQLGVRLFKLDRDSAMLIASGSSICGAAAVVATDGVLQSEAYKTSVAVATVVIFGTLSMFLYPALFDWNVLHLGLKEYGVYAGATVHEVAQAVVAGNSISQVSGDTAVIVKMTRVMMLAPFLLVVAFFVSRGSSTTGVRRKIAVPWFAVYFLGVVGINSLHLVPSVVVTIINYIDTFLLAMAMAALGIETNFAKVKHVGMKPVYLASILFVWLSVGGYFLVRLFA